MSSIGKNIAHGLIRVYQVTVSSFMGRQCRYLPTCSEYADTAIERFGVWPGVWMALARIGRCNPLGSSGYDPVPDEAPPNAHWYTPWRYARWRGCHIDPATRIDGD